MVADRNPAKEGKVTPDELTDAFHRLGLAQGDSVVMHASLESIGEVEGGAAMVLHRLLGVIGKEGTLLMPTFTSITRHSASHDNYAKPGCWCEGHEERHLPYIPELQPDKDIGEIAKRLCSWPASRRSGHPAYSFVAVGKHCDELVREYVLDDPLFPIKKFEKREPKVLMVGVGFSSVTAIHIAEQVRLKAKFARERALTFGAKGRTWVDIIALGCSRGFERIEPQLDKNGNRSTMIGHAASKVLSMKRLVDSANLTLKERPTGLLCGIDGCLSCSAVL